MPRQGQWVNGPKEVSMARRRYQKGSLVPKTGVPRNGLWVGRWREDVIQADGTITRPYKWEVLGTIRDYPTRKLALRALEARLSTVNSPTYRARPTATSCGVRKPVGCNGPFPTQTQYAKFDTKPIAEVASQRLGQLCAQGFGRPETASIYFWLRLQFQDDSQPGGNTPHDVE